MKPFVILSLILASFLLVNTTYSIIPVIVEIDIKNLLPSNSDPLITHCHSQSDDFGNRSLATGGVFSWKFNAVTFETTFYCQCWWNSKNANVTVYSFMAPHRCERSNPKISNTCYWQARADGFYFNSINDPISAGSWRLMFSWLG